MKLDNQTLALIAVGASVTANCQSCLEHNSATAAKCGANAEQISEAARIGRLVREGAASKLDKFAAGLGFASASAATNHGCECN
jgi:AhpD family alkylhydroperoxidase